MRDKVFVSYRRSDTRPTLPGIRETLERTLGEGVVFTDVTGIPLGAPFPAHLRDELDRMAVLLVVIGPGWADARDEVGGRRLDNPGDWVRIEVAYGLSCPAVTVVPVLVGGAPMPTAGELPDVLRPLCQRIAAVVDYDRWANDWRPIIERIAEVLGRPPAEPPRTAPPTGSADRREGNVRVGRGARTGTIVTNPNVGGDLHIG